MKRKPKRKFGPLVFIALTLVFLYAPIVIVVMFAFNDSPALSFPFAGLSTRWFARIFEDVQFSNAVRRSLTAGVVTALIAAPLGVALAFGIHRMRRSRAKALVLGVSLLPIVVPVLILGIGLAILINQSSVAPQLWTAVPGHVLIAMPFVVLTVTAALQGFPENILDAAADLGADPRRTFWTITFPLIRPAVEGAFLLAIALSIDEFVISLFTAGNATTLPLLIWAKLRRGIDPTINAISTLMLIGTIGLSWMAARRSAVGSSAR